MVRGQNIGAPPARRKRIDINKLMYKVLKCDEIYLWKVPDIVTSFLKHGFFSTKIVEEIVQKRGSMSHTCVTSNI